MLQQFSIDVESKLVTNRQLMNEIPIVERDTVIEHVNVTLQLLFQLHMLKHQHLFMPPKRFFITSPKLVLLKISSINCLECLTFLSVLDRGTNDSILS
ncbi:MAG: hypothetical protein EZS28_029663 [Streblomastix strix]|uniref:Uncharacterized protein n=1 Tax=Streblomastix strix TaxID=222440 RepID=A0A5J4UWG7_9EUKA|nr:MAG: hypothetical protein EZS28_029663 [Streblomastix strix]